MKKILIISVSILSVFILCSLSYQPIVADTQIEEIKENKISLSKTEMLRELHRKIVELKSKDNCGCKSNNQDFPLICGIIWSLFFICAGIWAIIYIPLSIIYEWAKLGNLELILDLINSFAYAYGLVLLSSWSMLLAYFDCIDLGQVNMMIFPHRCRSQAVFLI